MSRYVPLSKTQHAQSGLTAAGYEFALEKAIVPVVAEELPHLLPTMAMAFVKSGTADQFEVVALQSLHAGVNVYVHTNGRWIGGYRPAWYRGHPFRVLPDASGNRQVVCVDEESPAFEQQASAQAVRLFDENSEPTQRTRETMVFLEKLEQAASATLALVKQLDQAGVIVPWDPSAHNPKGESGVEAKDLYHIDEKALRVLSPQVLSSLARSGALSVAHTQLLSEHQLKGLARLYELRHLANTKVKPAHNVDLEDLFRDGDDDLSFNF